MTSRLLARILRKKQCRCKILNLACFSKLQMYKVHLENILRYFGSDEISTRQLYLLERKHRDTLTRVTFAMAIIWQTLRSLRMTYLA